MDVLIFRLKYFSRLLFILNFLGCSYYGSINLKKYKLSETPQKIIWLHVPGFDEQHISLLKFFYESAKKKTSFEQAACFGKTWSYNLYSLRPNHHNSFLSQISGSQNISGECSDYDMKPIWSYFFEMGHDIGVLEKLSMNKDSLAGSVKCSKENFLKEIVLFKMKKNRGENFFHAEEIKEFKRGKVYYDKSCQKEKCYNSLFVNIKSMLEKNYFKDKEKFFFLIRDDTFYNGLVQKDFKKIKNYLFEIDKIFNYLISLQEEDPTLLVFLSSSESIPIELPPQGLKWKDISDGKNRLIYHRSSLLSPIWAIGPRAENYCGIYEEADIMRRTLRTFDKKNLHIFDIPII